MWEEENYTDVEICEEVIRAISPDLPLRFRGEMI